MCCALLLDEIIDTEGKNYSTQDSENLGKILDVVVDVVYALKRSGRTLYGFGA